MTLDHAYLLRDCANLHYDSTCRGLTDRAGEGGYKNGLITIWINVLTFSSTDQVSASFRDLDLCLKALSMSDHIVPKRNTLANELRISFHKAIRLANTTLGGLIYESDNFNNDLEWSATHG